MHRRVSCNPSLEQRRRVSAPAALVIGLLTAVPSTVRAQDTLIAPPAQSEAMPSIAPRPATADLRPRALGASQGNAGKGQDAASRQDSRSASPSGSAGATLTQTLAPLGMVIGLILALGAGLKRFTRSRGGLAGAFGAMGPAPAPAGILEIIGRYPLARGTSLVLLKVDRRVLLLAQGSGGLRVRGGTPLPTTLCEITEPDDVASIMIKANEAEGRSIGETFRQALAGFERQHDGVIEERRPGLFGRFVRRGSGGDRAELIDENSFPNADDPLRLREFERGASDPVGSLRSRLTALRGGGAR